LTQDTSLPDRRKAQNRKLLAAEPRSAVDWHAELEVERTLGWLFIDIHRLLTKAFESRIKSMSLTRAQWRVMFALKRSDENEGLTQTELADVTEMEKAPLGKILDRLEEGGWIVRKKHPTDRRARLVSATAKIEKFEHEIAAAAKATFAQTLKGMRQHEVKDLVAQLEKLKRNLGGADDA
jgi:DNA-binding MarR family transcriptional regulator